MTKIEVATEPVWQRPVPMITIGDLDPAPGGPHFPEVGEGGQARTRHLVAPSDRRGIPFGLHGGTAFLPVAGRKRR